MLDWRYQGKRVIFMTAYQVPSSLMVGPHFQCKRYHVRVRVDHLLQSWKWCLGIRIRSSYMHTVWRVIFGGAKFREKSKPAFRINFRDYHQNKQAALRTYVWLCTPPQARIAFRLRRRANQLLLQLHRRWLLRLLLRCKGELRFIRSSPFLLASGDKLHFFVYFSKDARTETRALGVEDAISSLWGPGIYPQNWKNSFKARPRTNEIVVSRYLDLTCMCITCHPGVPYTLAKLAICYSPSLWLVVPGSRSQFLPLFPLQPPFEISTGQ